MGYTCGELVESNKRLSRLAEQAERRRAARVYIDVAARMALYVTGKKTAVPLSFSMPDQTIQHAEAISPRGGGGGGY